MDPQFNPYPTQAMQDAARQGPEQAGRIVQLSTDVSEQAARAGAQMMQHNTDTVQQALQSSAEIAARLTERSVDQFGRVLGISGDEAHRAAQQSSDNIDAILRSSSMLAVMAQGASREWADFARERMEQNFNGLDRLMRCRTPQDLAAIQSEFLRESLESFLQYSRRVAQRSMQMADEASRTMAANAEQARAA